MARSLRTNKTRILGFISEEVATTPYAGGIILGAQDAASAYGYMLFTVSTDGKASEENEIATLKGTAWTDSSIRRCRTASHMFPNR